MKFIDALHIVICGMGFVLCLFLFGGCMAFPIAAHAPFLYVVTLPLGLYLLTWSVMLLNYNWKKDKIG